MDKTIEMGVLRWGNYFLIAKGYQLTIELDH